MPAPAQATPRAKMATRAAFTAAITLAMLASLIPMASVAAAASLVAAGNTSVSADFAGTGSYAGVGNISVNGTAAADLSGTLVLTVPAGFVFRSSVGGAAFSGADCGDLQVVSTTVTTTTATVTTSGSAVGACTLTVSGLQVQPTAGTPLASGDIVASNMVAGNAGPLTEVAGAAVLTFSVEPAGPATGGTAFTTQPTVHDQDQHGNPRNGDAVTLSIASGTGGAHLTCDTNPVTTDVSGNAPFTGCKIDLIGTYTLRASVGASHADSAAVAVNLGPAAMFAFTSYPASASTTSLGTIAVAVVDAGGNTVTTDTRTITLSINLNPGGFSCSGGLSKAAVAGVATFTGCLETTVANGYIITATSGFTLAGNTFNVTSGAPAKLAFCWGSVASTCTTTPPTSPVGGGLWTPQPTIVVQDAGGNRVTSLNTGTATLSITSGTPLTGGPGTLTCSSGSSVAIIAGVASFAGCTIDKAGTSYKLTATAAAGYTSATSL
ncbi:MAG: hypothetical protein ACM3JP_00425, partial [Betaproteobacteria bacterium]